MSLLFQPPGFKCGSCFERIPLHQAVVLHWTDLKTASVVHASCVEKIRKNNSGKNLNLETVPLYDWLEQAIEFSEAQRNNPASRAGRPRRISSQDS